MSIRPRLTPGTPMTMEQSVQPLLVLSTVHLHPDTLCEMEAGIREGGSAEEFPGWVDSIGPLEFGHGLLWAGFHTDDADDPEEGYPVARWPDLAEIRGLALGLKCFRVLFDRDGPLYPGLTRYAHP